MPFLFVYYKAHVQDSDWFINKGTDAASLYCILELGRHSHDSATSPPF